MSMGEIDQNEGEKNIPILLIVNQAGIEESAQTAISIPKGTVWGRVFLAVIP